MPPKKNTEPVTINSKRTLKKLPVYTVPNDSDDEQDDDSFIEVDESVSKAYFMKNPFVRKSVLPNALPNFEPLISQYLQCDTFAENRKNDIKEAPIFYPSEEEFNEPMEYIHKIRPIAERYGICKIVPPAKYKLPTQLEKIGFKKAYKFGTKIQSIHQLQYRIPQKPTPDSPTITRFPDLAVIPPEPTDAAKKKNKKTRKTSERADEANNTTRKKRKVTKSEEDQTTTANGAAKAEDKMQVEEQKPLCIAAPVEITKEERKRMMGEFGYPRSDIEFSLASFKGMADEFLNRYFQTQIDQAKQIPAPTTLPRPVARRLGRRGGMQRVKNVLYYDDVKEVSNGDIHAEYWKVVNDNLHTQSVAVHYGSDVDVLKQGSGFKKSWGCGWNPNYLPTLGDSMLKYLFQTLPGINSPMAYIGMLFSSFCWHTEDNYLFSMNYIHHGAPKTWYGIPGPAAEKFEKVMREQLPELFEEHPNLLHQLVTMLSPQVLKAHGVPIYKMLHEEGTYMVTFAKAYHAGFNHGFNIAESVNFAPAMWIPYGRSAQLAYRKCARGSAFTYEELIVNSAQNFKQFDNCVRTTIKESLRQIIAGEEHFREANKAAGVKTEQYMGKKKPRKASVGDKDNNICIYCNQDCYLSAIAPKPKAERLTSLTPTSVKDHQFFCLRHLDKIRKDHNASKLVMYIRFDIADLKKLLDEITLDEDE